MIWIFPLCTGFIIIIIIISVIFDLGIDYPSVLEATRHFSYGGEKTISPVHKHYHICLLLIEPTAKVWFWNVSKGAGTASRNCVFSAHPFHKNNPLKKLWPYVEYMQPFILIWVGLGRNSFDSETMGLFYLKESLLLVSLVDGSPMRLVIDFLAIDYSFISLKGSLVYVFGFRFNKSTLELLMFLTFLQIALESLKFIFLREDCAE